MAAYDELQDELRARSQTWLVTGVAGFIGSNLLETLLRLGQRVTGLDNCSTGKAENLEEVRRLVTAAQWGQFRLIAGDICELETCREACAGVDRVLHQAALGSVPRSMIDPVNSHRTNVTGFLNMMVAAREAKVKRFVYASSSAVYGDHPGLPKVEPELGKPLSPYAATKIANEVYAAAFAQAYDFDSVGLRYFNVFGPRQDPEGAYAAVIPRWIAALLNGGPIYINGDGETSRDFCYVANVVQANLLAATSPSQEAVNTAYNIAVGARTTLNELLSLLRAALRRRNPALPTSEPIYQDFRPGDVRHSLADITKARRLLGYQPTHQINEGLEEACDWYVKNAALLRSH